MRGRWEPFMRTVRRLRRVWPRRLVLKATGEPVELVHVEEREGRRRCVVRRPDGSELFLAEAALASRLAWNATAVGLCLGLAAAGALAGGTASAGNGVCPAPAGAEAPRR